MPTRTEVHDTHGTHGHDSIHSQTKLLFLSRRVFNGSVAVLLAGVAISGNVANRFRWVEWEAPACGKLGVEIRTVVADLNGMSPTQYSLDMNLHRRHLNVSQLSMIGVKSLESFEREAKEKQKRKPVNSVTALGRQQKKRAPTSADKVAETLGVSGRSITRAKRVVTDGVPELVKEIEEGNVLLKPAEIIAKMPKEEQPAAIVEQNPINITPPLAYISSHTRGRG